MPEAMPAPRLERGMTDVRWFWTDLPPVEVESLASLLNEDEQARAARFRLSRDRARFIAARGRLRMLLGWYTGESPVSLELSAGPAGKPALRAMPGVPPIEFNLSHSEGIAVLAINAGDELGVDVERVRPLSDAGAIAARMFTLEERRALLGLPEGEQPAAFFHYWTRREALLKSLGWGLPDSPALVGHPVDAPDPALVEIKNNGSSTVRWIQSLPELSPGFVAAVATAGPTLVRCRYWPGG